MLPSRAPLARRRRFGTSGPVAHLLFLTSGPIGDCVLSTGVLEWGRRRLGGAPDVTIVCGPAAAPLFRAVPGLKRVAPLRKRPVGLHWPLLWATLAGESFDLVLDVRGSLLGLALSTRARLRGRPRGGDHKLAQLARCVGASAPLSPLVHLDPAAHAAAAPFGAPMLVLGPGGKFPGKRWPAARFVELAERLGAAPLVLGGPGEEALCAEVARASGGRSLCGELDLLGAAALLSRARLFVGNDSGLMHLAAAMGAPTLGLFGPSNARLYGPFGRQAAALRGGRTFEELCAAGWDEAAPESLLMDLSVAQVEAKARALLEADNACNV